MQTRYDFHAKELTAQPAAHESADDAQCDGDQAAARILAGHDELRDSARQQAKQYLSKDVFQFTTRP